MSNVGLTSMAGFLTLVLAMSGLPVAASPFATNVESLKVAATNSVVEASCCGWSPGWFFGGSYPAPAYYGGPFSGATYGYYYGSYWRGPYWRHRRHHLPK
jgi:hypothetical protein